LAETTAEHVRGKFVSRKLDVLRVKGKRKPMAVYELIAEGTSEDDVRQMIEKYESALADYQAQRWEEARAKLLELREAFPQDMPTRTLLDRISRFRSEPPGADWDGVYVAKEK
jgi:adenylate cyclase